MDLKLGFTKNSPPEVQINITHHYSSKTYTCGSAVTGIVTVTPRKDTPFERVRISLLGTARVTFYGVQSPNTATHYFLRTDMPLPASTYPDSMIFRSGNTYSIPFHLVIPDRLSSNACAHRVESHHIQTAHTRLPPSMGDWERHHMGPRTSEIEYSIHASIVALSEPRKRGSRKMWNKHVINVLPYFPEDPPLNITDMNIQYALEKSKRVRKRIFSAPEGRIGAVAIQPKAISLDPDGSDSSESSLLVNLTFEPQSPDIPPVAVNNISATLQIQTWSRQTPNIAFPNLGLLRDAYTDHISLISRQEVQASWMPSTKETGPGFEHSSPISYSSAIRVPFKLPTSKKVFLPTFHTCLVSRTYKIDIVLVVGNTSLRFTVPIQITMEHRGDKIRDPTHGCQLESTGISPGLGLRESCSLEDLWPLLSRPSNDDVLPSYSD